MPSGAAGGGARRGAGRGAEAAGARPRHGLPAPAAAAALEERDAEAPEPGERPRAPRACGSGRLRAPGPAARSQRARAAARPGTRGLRAGGAEGRRPLTRPRPCPRSGLRGGGSPVPGPPPASADIRGARMSHGAGVLHNGLSGASFEGGWPWDPGVLRGSASRGRGLAGCMGPAQRLCGLWAQPPGAPAGTLPLPSVQQPSVLGQAPLLPPPPPTSTGPCSCFLTTGSVLAVPASASLSPCILLSFGAILPEADPLSDLPHPTSSGDWVVLFGAVTTPALCPVPEVAGHSSCQGQKPR